MRRLPGLIVLGCQVAAILGCGRPSAPPRWWRGNLHTHSLWSDGDEYPEVLLQSYREHGYQFVSVSDHNVLATSDRWEPVGSDSASQRTLDRYLRLFGEDWVERRTVDSGVVVRLKRFDEYASRVEVPGEFLVIQGEEITDQFETKPLHVNATNVAEYIEPLGGGSVKEVLQNNIDAVLEQRTATGQPMFPHVNHPNFGWAVLVEDLMDLQGEEFFEVYNGHPAVHNEGDATRPSTERMWDILLSHRLTTDQPVMYGIAVDDAHHYQQDGPDLANPFRGWVMVRTSVLSADSIIAAMEAGHFYGSSGVELRSVTATATSLAIEIQPEDGLTYTTTFVGTRRGFDRATIPVVDVDGATVANRYSADIGKTLSTVEGTNPTYVFTGDELYVRARVRSSRLKRNPYHAGEFEQAWVQPVVVGAR